MKKLKDVKSCLSKLSANKWPNKGTVADARNDVLCLIKLAFESRNKSTIMVVPSWEEVFPEGTDYSSSRPIVKDVVMNKQNVEKCKIEAENVIKKNPGALKHGIS